MFIHDGLAHLLMNIYGLFFAGIFLEPMLGKTKFVLVYLLAGIVASLTSILFHRDTVTLGASGGIFGLYGTLLVLYFIKDFGRALLKDPLLINVAIFIGLNLLMGSLTVYIDNAAHVGGLVCGILLGMLFFPLLRRKDLSQSVVRSGSNQS
jgi:rhomboid protease GluP